MKLFFRKYGSGKPLVILHGLFGQSDNWNTLSKKFGDSGFEVYTADQRNHGMSPHSDEWSFEAMAADLFELIRDENLEAPCLIGHSMGGKALMFFELEYSGIAEKIVVADIAPRAYEAKHNEVLKALNSVDLDHLTSRKDAEAVLDNFGLDFGTKQFLLKNLYRKENGQDKFAWRFNLKVITEKYANVSVAVPEGKSEVPALFLRGERSNYITSEDERDILKRFPNAKIETINGAGHWIHAEKPQEFFDITLQFLIS